MLNSLNLKVRTAPVETVSESEEDILSSDDAGVDAPESPEAYDSAFESPSCNGSSGDERLLRLRDTTDDIFSDSEGEQWESFQQEDESEFDSECDCNSVLSDSELAKDEAVNDELLTSIKNVRIAEEQRPATSQPKIACQSSEAKSVTAGMSKVEAAPGNQEGMIVNERTNDSTKATGDSLSTRTLD